MNQMFRSERIKGVPLCLEWKSSMSLTSPMCVPHLRNKVLAVLKMVISNRRVINVRLFKKTLRTLNCSPKTLKVVLEIQVNPICDGRRREMNTKKKTWTTCWRRNTGMPLSRTQKHIISCCKKVSAEVGARHDIVVNVLLNKNILVQRGLIAHEQRWEQRKTIRTSRDERFITIPLQ